MSTKRNKILIIGTNEIDKCHNKSSYLSAKTSFQIKLMTKMFCHRHTKKRGKKDREEGNLKWNKYGRELSRSFTSDLSFEDAHNKFEFLFISSRLPLKLSNFSILKFPCSETSIEPAELRLFFFKFHAHLIHFFIYSVKMFEQQLKWFSFFECRFEFYVWVWEEVKEEEKKYHVSPHRRCHAGNKKNVIQLVNIYNKTMYMSCEHVEQSGKRRRHGVGVQEHAEASSKHKNTLLEF